MGHRDLPATYELTYHVEPAAAGAVVLKGELLQKGVPDEESGSCPSLWSFTSQAGRPAPSQ
jgi:hypothetical protein